MAKTAIGDRIQLQIVLLKMQKVLIDEDIYWLSRQLPLEQRLEQELGEELYDLFILPAPETN